MSARRGGLSLLEALMAGLIFLLAMVPTLGLLTTTQSEITKVQERLLAVNLAMSIVEEMRARRPADRASYPPRKPAELAHLSPLIEAQRTANPAGAAAVDAQLAHFTCEALVATSPPRVVAKVTWTEAGQGKSQSLEARLDP